MAKTTKITVYTKDESGSTVHPFCASLTPVRFTEEGQPYALRLVVIENKGQQDEYKKEVSYPWLNVSHWDMDL